eukprot:Sspe_Gene.114814::Locus_101088_Transcript_2_2_Confidence_0.833_Length_1368::g.114814::m.114814
MTSSQPRLLLPLGFLLAQIAFAGVTPDIPHAFISEVHYQTGPTGTDFVEVVVASVGSWSLSDFRLYQFQLEPATCSVVAPPCMTLVSNVQLSSTDVTANGTVATIDGVDFTVYSWHPASPFDITDGNVGFALVYEPAQHVLHQFSVGTGVCIQGDVYPMRGASFSCLSVVGSTSQSIQMTGSGSAPADLQWTVAGTTEGTLHSGLILEPGSVYPLHSTLSCPITAGEVAVTAGSIMQCTIRTYDRAGVSSGSEPNLCRFLANLTYTEGACFPSPFSWTGDQGIFLLSLSPTVAGVAGGVIQYASSLYGTETIGTVEVKVHPDKEDLSKTSSSCQVIGSGLECVTIRRDQFGNEVRKCTQSWDSYGNVNESSCNAVVLTTSN